jgi:ABC-type dipeptide/oligopeptide/nickel transport system permease component
MMYFLRKGIYYSSLWGGVIVFSFILFHAVPSDPARIALGANAEQAQVEALRKEMGLDAPLPIQFLQYVGKISQFDFGASYVDRRSVAEEVGTKLRVSLTLIGMSLTLTLIYIALVVAMAATRTNGFWDYLDLLWVSLPTLFSGVGIALLAVDYYPYTTFSGTFESIGDYLYLLPAAFVLALYPMAILSRIVRAEMVRVDGSLYILAARASGLSEWTVIGKLVLKNLLVPFLAAFSNQIPILFTGTFIVEVIFSVPGIGSLLIRSLLERDFPMLEGIVILNGLVVILVHWLVEAVYPLVDPRIRSRHAQ